MICRLCPSEIIVYSKSRYKRKFPDLCQLCALTKTRPEARSNPIHGHRMKLNGEPKRTKLYVKWVNMKMSCYNPNYKDYRLVGAKGIKMDASWLKFDSFKKWADSKFYKDGMILKRIDNDKDFCPSNCRFISKNANVMLEFRGKKATLHEMKKAFRSNIPENIIRGRLEKKWPLLDAFLQPVGFKLGRNKRRVPNEIESENRNLSCN